MARALKLALVVTGALALLVWLMPDLIVIGFLFLILPGIALSLMPSIFLYLCIFSVLWFLTRQHGEVRAALYGLAAISAVAFGVPLSLNSRSEQYLAELRRRELTPKQQIQGGGVVTLELPRSFVNSECNELCQLLLFNDEAEQVVLRAEKAKAPKAFRIERENCQVDLASLERMLQPSYRNWGSSESAKAVAQAVKARIAGGDCLVETSPETSRSELTIRWVDDNADQASQSWKLKAAPPWSKGVEVTLRSELVARQTRSGVSLLALPLLIEPISNGMGFRGWRWSRKMELVDESKIDRIGMLRRLTLLDLETPRGLGSSSVRKHLDAALADSSGSNVAFVLLGDYYKSLREEGFEVRDRDRLVRLILDDRVTDFSYFNWSEKQRNNVGVDIRDAMLRRLLRLRANLDEQKARAVFSNLEHVAARLGPGTYAGEVPLLYEVLEEPRTREWSPGLVKRLAEQGKKGTETLVRILEEKPSRSGREVNAALAGLCEVGEAAKDFLPRLRAVSGDIARGNAWRGMLIRLGADEREFRSPNYPDQTKYWEQLRQEAKACQAKRGD